jgi:hypothetical protein
MAKWGVRGRRKHSNEIGERVGGRLEAAESVERKKRHNTRQRRAQEIPETQCYPPAGLSVAVLLRDAETRRRGDDVSGLQSSCQSGARDPMPPSSPPLIIFYLGFPRKECPR